MIFLKNSTKWVYLLLGAFLSNMFLVSLLFSVVIVSPTAWAQNSKSINVDKVTEEKKLSTLDKSDTSTKRDSKSNSKKKVLLVIGDSITEGYGVPQSKAFPAIVQKLINQDKINWTIKAAGSSGSTSASGLERIKWLTKNKPDLILILLGSNDGLRGIKTEETEKNLTQTIQWAQKNNFKVVLGQLEAPPNYGKEYTDNFRKIFPKIAKENKILLAPFILKNVGGRSDLNLPDGIHPNEKGHEILAQDLYKFLKPHLTKK